jgi:hypothetical protein
VLSHTAVTAFVWITGGLLIFAGAAGLLFRRKLVAWADRGGLSSNYDMLPQAIRSRIKGRAQSTRILVLYVCIASVLVGFAILGIGLSALD